ncbi:MAG: NAD-dependent epimerase/dehydratase family protein [Dehalococcoidia bacterium]|nr:NAD-dependent epimerase/dehydratase family protein [Dehalococcoidia bacterium]
MRLLIIGGTQFVGRHIVDGAMARGHQVTLFNRGSNPEVPAGVERITGDRDGGLEPLRGRTWDAVIDTPGYVPRVVRQSAELLADAVSRYVFISTISVYAEFEAGMDETAPLARLRDPATEEVTGRTYGGLKALCEAEVQRVYGERALIVRPGFVVGPYDHTDRFTYWLVRVARGGEVLAPGSPDAPIQFIDARDLAEFTVGLVEAGAGGAYNATGPESSLTWGEFFETTQRLSLGHAVFTWADDHFLMDHRLDRTGELPLWVPSASGLHGVSIAKARAAGLRTRPLAETVADTLEWRQELDAPLAAGMDPDREAELLREWHTQGEQ